ncbi:hypothetical protein BH10PSE2_BH10PSE2_00440 [soil metagenome]
MHRARLFQALVLLLFALGALVWRLVVRRAPGPPPPEAEIIILTASVRASLQALRDTRKFKPEGDYAGPATPTARKTMAVAINRLIKDILGEPEGSALNAGEVSDRLGVTLAALADQTPADNARAWRYVTDIWHILGFTGPTGYERPELAPGEAHPVGRVAAPRANLLR